MKTLNQVNKALRHYNRKHYRLLFLCSFFSVLLITAYVTMMQSKTVLSVLPEGGDSRKQVMAIFVLSVIACAMFVSYTASLFFKYKAREVGIFMALGISSRKLKTDLLSEICTIGVSACILGALLGTPFAYVIWQSFRLTLVNTQEMTFFFSPRAYLFAGIFSLFVLLMLLFMTIHFIRQTNIIDILNCQRKSEPVHDVKSWFGWSGILLILIGGLGGYLAPAICIKYLNWYPPAWINLTYLPLFIGLYMVLLYTVIHGWKKGKNRYKDILTRSIMKFQGKQTVNNMLIITVLLAGAYFASFYAPIMTSSAMLQIAERPTDYLFHTRQDQYNLTQADIEDLAKKYGINIADYKQTTFANLGRDGNTQVEESGGTYHYEYKELLAEENILSASSFTQITGKKAEISSGKLKAVLPDDNSNSFLTATDITLLTNPVTGNRISVSFDGYLNDNMLATKYYVLNDDDYEKITVGLTKEWKEYLTVFNVEHSKDSYDFANALYKEIIDHSGKECEIPQYYDRINKQATEAEGNIYWGDTLDLSSISYDNYQSFAFKTEWKYAPTFRILDKTQYLTTFAVFLMLFIFIALICFTAVFLIAYTRCMTIAINNRQVYSDLKHLGASYDYLYASVKSQIGKVFKIPVIVGTALIYFLYGMIMFMNDTRFTSSELIGLFYCAVLVIVITIAIWAFYRFTLKKVCKLLDI